MSTTPLHRKRCVRWNSPHHAHYLTFSCYRRSPFFTKDRPCRWFINAIAAARLKYNFDLWAWVIMPEHAHLLLHPRPADYRISAILKSIKLPVTRRAVAYLKHCNPNGLAQLAHPRTSGAVTYRFWQTGGGYDRNLYTGTEIWEKIDYIHNNPRRRKLVSCAVDWPWSSAVNYARISEGLLPIDLDSLPLRP